MFGLSISDRLKAAVTQLEATGSSLQQKALAGAQSVAAGAAGPGTASPAAGASSSKPASGPRSRVVSPVPSRSATPKPGQAGSPSSPGGRTDAAQLAENALSGLRKSFAARHSTEVERSASPEKTEPDKDVKKEGAGELSKEGVEDKVEPVLSEPVETTAVGVEEEVPVGGESTEGNDEGKGQDSTSDPAVDVPSVEAIPSETTPEPMPSESEPVNGHVDKPAEAEDAPIATASASNTGARKKKNKKKKKGGKKAAGLDEEEADDEPPAPTPTQVATPAETPADTPADADDIPSIATPSAAITTLPTTLQDHPPAEAAPAEQISSPEPQSVEETATTADIAPSTEVTEPADDVPVPAVTPKVAEGVADAVVADAAKTVADVAAKNPDEGQDDVATRLAAAERRFEDLSERYTVLLSQSHAANSVLKELTPLEGGIGDADALEGWVRMVTGKVDMMTIELRRLQEKQTLQDSRMEEMRDTHRLESKSQTELVSKLRTQLAAAEKDLGAKGADMVQLGQLRGDLEKARQTAKEEEEKRSKAMSLLKAVRQKNIKLEKEKEEIEKDRAEERAERSRAAEEVERIKADKEREVTNLRKGFEREVASVKERAERDLASKKGAWELEMITTKAAHAKELSNKQTKLTGLEAAIKELQGTNSSQFATIQARQSESESARAEAETLRARTSELEFQLREATERVQMLEDAPRTPSIPQESASPSRGTSASEVQRLLADADARAETKLSDLRARVRALERERNELEEDWAAKLAQRVRELESLRATIADKDRESASWVAAKKERDATIEAAEAARRALEREMVQLRTSVDEAHADVAVALDAERAAREELASLQGEKSGITTQLEEAKAAHEKLRLQNRTLRDELRKVQSSAQLLERQRGPGVGYWAGASAQNAGPSPPPTETARRESNAAPEEEEVNLEYLRNVILQFLEHKEMRPNLVRVLGVILRFTPQELRRLNARISS